ncbi:MAG: S9 family peptidase [Candidatus Latescibacteria bacterium]|nr:S9 family peptidase [bacterium]MCB9517163.1 S9 family peptidase [Candidatus Latescibacterota bacterium]
MSRQFLSACLIALALPAMVGCATKHEEQAPLIAMQDFFRNPEQTSFQLSPDGRYFSWLQPWEGRLNVHVRAVDSDQVTRVTSSTARDIFGYGWANPNRLVYVQDSGGDENYHAYAVDLDGGNFLDLTPFESVQTRFVDALEDDDDHMLLAINDRDPRIHDVYKVDVNTGALERVAENPGNITGWQTDNAGHVRVATTTDGVNSSLLYRETESEPFKTVLTTNFKESLQPLSFTFDDSLLYVASNIGRDKTAIFTYDPRTATQLDLIYEHPEVDVENLMRSRHRKVITGVAYFTDKRGYKFFDEDRRQLQETLESQLPGVEVAVASMSRDERRVLVRTFSDKTRGAYYYLDRDGGKLEKLVEVSPWLDAAAMADMKPVQYTSRDGLTIHGYLTLPRGIEAKNLPVVVNPHGGPWARDYWGFNPEVQFLANRGYAVLQMNFRGSTGYGKEFWTKSFRQWGLTMQDDVTDGVKWLINQGVADPDRIGIYGGSYGGYATLAGVTFTPDLYACGVDYVGVSNIFTWMKAFPPYWEPFIAMVKEMVGDPDTDPDFIRSISPFFHVDQIQVPMLVAQGANDPRVNKAESDQIVEALRGRGIEVEYMVKDNEGHGFANEENRFDFYGAMEKFLGKHLGGSVSPEPAPGSET